MLYDLVRDLNDLGLVDLSCERVPVRAPPSAAAVVKDDPRGRGVPEKSYQLDQPIGGVRASPSSRADAGRVASSSAAAVATRVPLRWRSIVAPA